MVGAWLVSAGLAPRVGGIVLRAAPFQATYSGLWCVGGTVGAVGAIVVVLVSTSVVVHVPVRQCGNVRGARARSVLVSSRAFGWCADRRRARSRSRVVDGQHGHNDDGHHVSKRSYITPFHFDAVLGEPLKWLSFQRTRGRGPPLGATVTAYSTFVHMDATRGGRKHVRDWGNVEFDYAGPGLTPR